MWFVHPIWEIRLEFGSAIAEAAFEEEVGEFFVAFAQEFADHELVGLGGCLDFFHGFDEGLESGLPLGMLAVEVQDIGLGDERTEHDRARGQIGRVDLADVFGLLGGGGGGKHVVLGDEVGEKGAQDEIALFIADVEVVEVPA